MNIAQTMIELDVYRLNDDKEGVKPYLKDDIEPLKLPDPASYWRYFAENMPNLQKLASLIFTILPSSSICETNFRDHEFIYTNAVCAQYNYKLINSR